MLLSWGLEILRSQEGKHKSSPWSSSKVSWDRGSHAGQTNGKLLNQILHFKHKLNHITSSLHLVSFTQIDRYLPSTLTLFKEVLVYNGYMYVLWITKGHMTPVKVLPLHGFLEANIYFLYIPWSSLHVRNKKLGLADAKKFWDDCFETWDGITGSFFQLRTNSETHISYISTSVCTIDILCDRISDTSPKMSTNSWSRMCCKSLSRAMNVPVRPTPALQECSDSTLFRQCFYTVKNKLVIKKKKKKTSSTTEKKD